MLLTAGKLLTTRLRLRLYILYIIFFTENDITVLTLPRKLIFSDCIQPIAVAQPGERFYSNCIIAGWGETRGEYMLLFVKILKL